MQNSLTVINPRYKKLEFEFRHALSNTSPEEFKRWALYTSLVFPNVAIRRAKNLGEFAGKIVKGTYSEAKDFVQAGIKRELVGHTKQRTNDLVTFSKESWKDFKDLTGTITEMIRTDPKKAAIQIFVATIGFNAGGGGIDGDGGIPDLDLMVSIGAHRSIFTHSILPMIVFEGLFLSMIGLVKIIHGNLPPGYDPLWDDIKSNNEKVLETFFNGMSAGLILHLGIDATLDGEGTYKNLPFSMPQFGHQILTALNSLTELVDLKSKKKKMFWKNTK